jgi:hypothetical protein
LDINFGPNQNSARKKSSPLIFAGFVTFAQSFALDRT